MKLIVREHVTAVAEPIKKVFNITIDAVNNFAKIPMSIGLVKGDLIAFRGSGDPVRLPVGNVAGRVLTADPDAESGMSWQPPAGGSGSSVTLHNITGVLVPGGTVVKINTGYDFVKATSADTTMLFVTADDCAAGDDVACYSTANTICSVLCTSDAVAVNDKLCVSSTDGVAEATSGDGFAVALSAKAAGSAGPVDAMIVQAGFLPLIGGTVTGNVTIEKADTPQLIFSNADGNKSTIQGKRPSQNTYGGILLIHAGGNCVVGGGEFAGNAYNANVEDCQSDSEFLLLGSDVDVFIISNAQTIANRKTWKFSKEGTTTLPTPLSAANGGTGQSSLQATRNAMGLGNTTGALPIANGGTGKTTVQDARGAFGFASSPTQGFPDAVSVANNTSVALQSITFYKGVYLLVYQAIFAANANGYRMAWMTDGSDSDMGFLYEDTCKPNGTVVDICARTVLLNVTAASQTVKIKVKQTSGGYLETRIRYQYFKLA